MTVTKWHINADDKVAPCKATVMPCPYTKERHFTSKEEAYEAAAKMWEQKYKILADTVKKENKKPEIKKEETKTLTSDINKQPIKNSAIAYKAKQAANKGSEIRRERVAGGCGSDSRIAIVEYYETGDLCSPRGRRILGYE